MEDCSKLGSNDNLLRDLAGNSFCLFSLGAVQVVMLAAIARLCAPSDVAAPMPPVVGLAAETTDNDDDDDWSMRKRVRTRAPV